VLLSARPQEVKALSISRDDEIALKLDGIAALENEATKVDSANDLQWGVAWDRNQYGSVVDGLDWLAYGERKFESARDRMQHWGYPFVFVGDDGQGDLMAATKMYTELAPVDATRGKCVDAWQNGQARCAGFSGAFIHRVFDWSGSQDRIPKRLEWVNSLGGSLIENVDGDYSKEEIQALAEKGIFLFYTYSDAAWIAFHKGFISREGFHRVIAEIVMDHMELSEERYWKKQDACAAPKSITTAHYYEQVFGLNPGDYEPLVTAAASASRTIASPCKVRFVLRCIVAAIHEQMDQNSLSEADQIPKANAVWNGSSFDKPERAAALVPLVLQEFSNETGAIRVEAIASCPM